MKRLVYILLLGIFVLQAGGLLLFYQCRQQLAYCVMSEKLNIEKDFEKITLSASDYKKNKLNKREISLNGKLYDIKSEIRTVDGVELELINDSAEENIWKEIQSYLGNTDQHNNDLPYLLCHLLLLNYTPPQEPEQFYISAPQTVSFADVAARSISHSPGVTNPPPEL